MVHDLTMNVAQKAFLHFADVSSDLMLQGKEVVQYLFELQISQSSHFRKLLQSSTK